ncbi:MAG TPA: DUF692 domain-containing protein [Labilithrix sp.]|nr:DUF692 domain-containing protein [Labilithrix sp.]
MTALAGVGIGLRREIAEGLLATRRHLDWVEVVSENFAGQSGRPRDVLRRARERWPVVPHGVALSVGSGAPAGYLDVVAELVSGVEAPFFSDHLCYASLGAHAFHDLLPLPFHEEAVALAAANAQAAARAVGRPLLLENVTYYATMPGSVMTEAAFLRSVVAAAGDGVGLLLDVNNLYVNAVNHGRDPRAELDAFPLESVRQLHLAGHTREGDVLLDTHAAPIAREVWELYRDVLRRTGPLPTLIEWDQNIPNVDAVLDEADRARTILEAA